MDVLKLCSHGFPAVASLGTSITENQLELLINITDKIYIVNVLRMLPVFGSILMIDIMKSFIIIV